MIGHSPCETSRHMAPESIRCCPKANGGTRGEPWPGRARCCPDVLPRARAKSLQGWFFFSLNIFFSELDESHLLVVICCNFAMYYWIGYLLCRVSCGSRGVAVWNFDRSAVSDHCDHWRLRATGHCWEGTSSEPGWHLDDLTGRNMFKLAW